MWGNDMIMRRHYDARKHLGAPRYARAEFTPLVPAECKGCVWVRTDGGKVMCPFARCVRWEGWAVTASGLQP